MSVNSSMYSFSFKHNQQRHSSPLLAIQTWGSTCINLNQSEKVMYYFHVFSEKSSARGYSNIFPPFLNFTNMIF